VPSGVFDLRCIESYFTVRRARRSEKTTLGAVHRRPQQEAGEKCGLAIIESYRSPKSTAMTPYPPTAGAAVMD